MSTCSLQRLSIGVVLPFGLGIVYFTYILAAAAELLQTNQVYVVWRMSTRNFQNFYTR